MFEVSTPISTTARRPDSSDPSNSDTQPGAPDPAAALSVRALTRIYHRPRTSLFHASPAVQALRGVSFDVAPGERFGIVGESGSGKSTLLKILAGLDRPTAGTVTVHGAEITNVPERKLGFLREQLQVVFQDPMSSLDPHMRIADIVAEPLVALRHPGIRDRVQELLAAVGLDADAGTRFPHQFSGGQRQRISIARALAPKPRIILADEPVSALDVSVRAQVLNLLADIVDELSLTLVFISHDLSVVRHVCERVAVMHRGTIVELGPVDEIYDSPQDPYTKSLIAAVPTISAAIDRAALPAADLLQ